MESMRQLFEEIPYLEGEGITLKGVTLADKEQLQELVDSPAVQRYLPTFLFEQKYDDMEYVISHLYDECLEDSLILGIYKPASAGAGSLEDTGSDLAFCGLAEMYGYREELHKISLGCRLLEEYWGQGIVAKALQLMVDFLYDEKGIEIITASTMAVNRPAAKAVEAAGFDLVAAAAPEDWGYPEPTPTDKWIR